MNEEEKVIEFIRKVKALEKEYGVELQHSVFTDRLVVSVYLDSWRRNDYDYEDEKLDR